MAEVSSTCAAPPPPYLSLLLAVDDLSRRADGGVRLLGKWQGIRAWSRCSRTEGTGCTQRGRGSSSGWRRKAAG